MVAGRPTSSARHPPGPHGELARLVATGAIVVLLLVGVMLAATAPADSFRTSDVGLIGVAALMLGGVVIARRLIVAVATVRWRPAYAWMLVAAVAIGTGFWIMLTRAAPGRGFTRVSTPIVAPAPRQAHVPAPPHALFPVVLTVAVVAAVVAALWEASRWWRGSAAGFEATTTEIGEDALLDAIDAALLDLRAVDDPRQAVIAAYAAAEATLGAHGARRRSAESPIEYLDRVLRVLGARGASVDQLTELYEQARFSEHTIDGAMREQAIAAFETLRSQLLTLA